ncbi:hypothetical protein WJX72_000634 [[Myrmecia] bisecta]|uniref:FAD-binding FR-type domain-containing protein n=1 Tax=[Myrmecia] bisecta TaxID=41462 RepID=A0AAW1QE01_9CHLO
MPAPRAAWVAAAQLPTKERSGHSFSFKPSLCGCFGSSRRWTSKVSALRGPSVVFASWGAEVQWSKGQVLSTKQVAEGLQTVVVDLNDVGSGYTKAGQFVQVKVGDSKPSFFAIASPPDANNAGVVELLVKNNEKGGTAEILCNSQEGFEVDVSPVMGKGFPIERAPADEVSTLLFFATGTGISPVRALIESGTCQLDKRKQVRLYYGTANPEATAYRELVSSWKELGVEVVPVYSDDEQGYVQDVFAQDGRPLDGASTAAVLVGQKEMCMAITDMLTQKGVTKERILLNF